MIGVKTFVGCLDVTGREGDHRTADAPFFVKIGIDDGGRSKTWIVVLSFGHGKLLYAK